MVRQAAYNSSRNTLTKLLLIKYFGVLDNLLFNRGIKQRRVIEPAIKGINRGVKHKVNKYVCQTGISYLLNYGGIKRIMEEN